MSLKHRIFLISFIFLSALLTTCAQYRGRTIYFKYVKPTEAKNYASNSRSISGLVEFKNVKETDTLRQMFENKAIENNFNPETDGFGPNTWGIVWEYDENTMDYGFTTLTGEEKLEYSFVWSMDNLENISFVRDNSYNRYTVGLDSKVGDIIALYPDYKITSMKTDGTYHMYLLHNVIDSNGNDRVKVIINDYAIQINAATNSYVIPKYLYRKANLYDSAFSNPITPDRYSKPETKSRIIYDLYVALYGPGTTTNMDTGDLSKKNEYGFISYYDFIDKDTNYTTSDKNALKLASYPVFRGKDGEISTSITSDNIDETNKNYYYFLNDMVFDDENYPEEYYVVTSTSEIDPETGVFKTLDFEKNTDGTYRTVKPGDKVSLDDLSSFNGLYLFPKYMIPYIDLTMKYTISPVGSDGKIPKKDGVEIKDKNGTSIEIKDSGDPSIDNKGFPKPVEMEAIISVRPGSTLGEVSDTIISRISSNTSALDDENAIYWPMDLDIYSYLVESSLITVEDTYQKWDFRGTDAKIPDYNRMPTELSTYRDPKTYKSRRKNYYTYDYARELLYGYRDYKSHGKRYFFDLKKQGMARDNADSVETGGEWEVSGLPANQWVDYDGKLGTSDVGENVFYRPINGRDYKFYTPKTIKPHYINAGYAPIPRQFVAETGTDFTDPNNRRRLDIFSNFVYIPGSQNYPVSTVEDLNTVSRKFSILNFDNKVGGVSVDQRKMLTTNIFKWQRDTVNTTSKRRVKSFEAMEIPLTKNFVIHLWGDEYPQNKKNDYQSLFLNPALGSPDPKAEHVVTGPGDLCFEDATASGLGINYSYAKKICNKMTEMYNLRNGTNLSYCYDPSSWKYIPAGTGFRLPTIDEYEYMNKIVTQEQQIVPTKSSDYSIELRIPPHHVGQDSQGKEVLDYDLIKYADLNTSPGNAEWDPVSSFYGNSSGATKVEGYYFHTGKAVPGVHLYNYSRDTNAQERFYSGYKDGFTSFSFTSDNGYFQNTYRSIFEASTIRYEAIDTLRNTANIQNLNAFAKRSMNVRSGSGLFDGVNSGTFIVEPEIDETGNWLQNLYISFANFTFENDISYRADLPTGDYHYSANPDLSEYELNSVRLKGGTLLFGLGPEYSPNSPLYKYILKHTDYFGTSDISATEYKKYYYYWGIANRQVAVKPQNTTMRVVRSLEN